MLIRQITWLNFVYKCWLKYVALNKIDNLFDYLLCNIADTVEAPCFQLCLSLLLCSGDQWAYRSPNSSRTPFSTFASTVKYRCRVSVQITEIHGAGWCWVVWFATLPWCQNADTPDWQLQHDVDHKVELGSTSGAPRQVHGESCLGRTMGASVKKNGCVFVAALNLVWAKPYKGVSYIRLTLRTKKISSKKNHCV